MEACGRIASGELFKRLSTLQGALKAHINHLNYGGCGVIAGMVGTTLNGLGVICDIVTPDDGMPASEVRNNVGPRATARTWWKNGLDTSHLAVRFRVDGVTYIWDSDSLCTGGDMFGGESGDIYVAVGQLGDGLTAQECVSISSKKYGWNSSFDRAQIPLLRTLVEYHLQFGL